MPLVRYCNRYEAFLELGGIILCSQECTIMFLLCSCRKSVVEKIRTCCFSWKPWKLFLPILVYLASCILLLLGVAAGFLLLIFLAAFGF